VLLLMLMLLMLLMLPLMLPMLPIAMPVLVLTSTLPQLPLLLQSPPPLLLLRVGVAGYWQARPAAPRFRPAGGPLNAASILSAAPKRPLP
jgi:hypothetical protein